MLRIPNISVRYIAIGLAVVAIATASRADDPKDKSNADNKLVGTWKLVSAKYGGESHDFGDLTTVKHVTPTHFMWASYAADGTVTRTAGGRYTLKGEDYVETPEYGISGDFDTIKGQAQAFTWKVEGDKWHHTGKLSNGLTIEEVWQRAEKQ